MTILPVNVFAQDIFVQSTDTATYIIEKKLSVCYFEVPDRDDIYGVVEVNQKMGDIPVLAFFDTSVGVLEQCNSKRKYNRNTIKINDSKLRLGNKINGININTFIPQKLILITKDKTNYIVFEMYQFSTTTVGGGYDYIILKLNQANEIEKHSIYECDKKNSVLPMKKLLKVIEQI